MNEISVFFTFAPISLSKMRQMDLNFGIIKIENNGQESSKDELVSYKDKDIVITLLNTGALVNVPAKEYRDFETTAFVWNGLENVMKTLGVEPAAWIFTKGNRFVFTEPITYANQKEALEMVLSPNYLSLASDKRLFFEESSDKTKLFSCQYGFEESKEKGILVVKFMIATQRYSINGLCSQVMETNKLMFDGWHWAMSDGMLHFLDQPKEDTR